MYAVMMSSKSRERLNCYGTSPFDRVCLYKQTPHTMAQKALTSLTAGEPVSPTSPSDRTLSINMDNGEKTPLLRSGKEGDSESEVAPPRT